MMKGSIRNFAIIAHIDHGKSTLADRFLEVTGTVSKQKLKEQFLDQNPISRERGITIKLAPVRMKYEYRNPKSETITNASNSNNKNNFEFRVSNFEFSNSGEFILNLIDTPGHVDFSYEVSRTLAACEGVILLVDATQGVQAQTVAHFYSAKKEGLKIIPAINKIDLESARPEEVRREMEQIFSINPREIIYVSAKTGKNVDQLLRAIVDRTPSPKGLETNPFRALIFDALYDEHRGVIVYVRIVDGKLSKNERISFSQTKKSTIASEIGYFTPVMTPKDTIFAGDIGYIVTGIKDIHQTQVGDTVTISNIKNQISNIKPLPGYKKPKPMVFFGVYPKSTNELVRLKEALNKYALNDTSITVSDEHSIYLGSGFRVGFLGLLHADIVRERLKQEENVDLFLTSPQVLYEEKENGQMNEPYMNLTVFVPSTFVGNVITVCQKRKGNLLDLSYFGNSAILKYEMPYSMLVRGLSSDLKSSTSGFASIDYEISDYRPADLVNIEIKINDISIDVLSEYAYRGEAPYIGREKAKLLREKLPRQQFRQIIQATVNGNIIAREEIPPFRKDVLAKLYGGDRTRKDKLLEAQKKGKSKMIEKAKIEIPQEVLFSMIEK
ncbi:MAG: elongation factor 4 [Candidatus Levybacteria bacterium]|nr:elongation factor 4 [Candidatus Levybacteria bacterium]